MATVDDEDSKNLRFLELKASGKRFYKNQEYPEALEKFEEAYKLIQQDSMKRKIDKLKEYLASDSSSSDGSSSDDDDNRSESLATVAEGLELSKTLYDQLYQYQKEGLRWMWGLHQRGKGGILADDMGLGKTVQIISFLTALMDSSQIKTALIVMPVSLIQNWEAEIATWSPGLRHRRYHGSSSIIKERNLRAIQNRGGILFTSYGMIVSSGGILSKRLDETKFKWDYIILDEGHKIKNPTKTTKSIHEFVAGHRLVLTGTPVQNNLKELWALYDFCHQGTLLGTLTTFKAKYETPINRSREKDATVGEKNLGSKIAENLRNLIAPYFLRRTKADTMKSITDLRVSGKTCASLPKKNELIVWVHLSQQQVDIYQQFLESDVVREILTKNRRNPLVYLVAMKKICDHPRLFSVRARSQLRGQINLDESDDEVPVPNDPVADHVSLNVDPYLLLKESGKMEVLIKLLENLKKEGHRTLVFSLSRKILDIIQKILMTGNWNILRLDGTVRNLDERQRRINLFQNSTQYSVFLLTTQVGGVGLNLTAADRVVIYDPSWNPATDAQAVDRAYRIGQTKDVVVYRLITCGAIEEKIYRRQIFKDSITRQATCKGETDKDPHRYFTKSELRELFVLDDPMSSNTQIQLTKLHEHLKNTTPQLDEHIGHLEGMIGHVFGVSHHDLMFHGNLQDDSDDSGVHEEERIIQEVYIQQQVRDAQQRLQLESEKNEIQAKVRGVYKTTYFEEAQADAFYSLPGHDDEMYDNALTIDVALFDHDEEDAFMDGIKIPEIISQLVAFPERTVAEFSPASTSSAHLDLNIAGFEDTEVSSISTQSSTTQPGLPQNADDSSTNSSQSSYSGVKSIESEGKMTNKEPQSSRESMKSLVSNPSTISHLKSSGRANQSTFKFGVPKKYARSRKLVTTMNVGPRRLIQSRSIKKASNVRKTFHVTKIEMTKDESSSIVLSSNPANETNSLFAAESSSKTTAEFSFHITGRPSTNLPRASSTNKFTPAVSCSDISGDSGVNEVSPVVNKLEKKLKRERKKCLKKDKAIEDLTKNRDALKLQLTSTNANLLEMTKQAARWKKLLEIKDATLQRLSVGGIENSQSFRIRSESGNLPQPNTDVVPTNAEEDARIDIDKELELLRLSLGVISPKAIKNPKREIKTEPRDATTSLFNSNSIEKDHLVIKNESIDSNFRNTKDPKYVVSLDSDDDDELPIIILDSTPSAKNYKCAAAATSSIKVERRSVSPTIELLDNCLNSYKSDDKPQTSDSNLKKSFKRKTNCDSDFTSQIKPKNVKMGDQSCDESIVQTLLKSRGEKKPPKWIASNPTRIGVPTPSVYLDGPLGVSQQTPPKTSVSCDDVMMATLRKSRQPRNDSTFPTMKFTSSKPIANPLIISLTSPKSSFPTLHLSNLPQKAPVDDFFANILKSKLDKERNQRQGLDQGLNQGSDQGLNQGSDQGLNQGSDQGLNQGSDQGLNQGSDQGLNQGLSNWSPTKIDDLDRPNDRESPKLDAESLFNQLIRDESSISNVEVNDFNSINFEYKDQSPSHLPQDLDDDDDSACSLPKTSVKIDTESIFNSLLETKPGEKSLNANNYDDSTDSSEPPSFFQTVKEKFKDLFTFDADAEKA